MNISKISHIGINVNDLQTGIKFWQDILGLELDYIEDVPSFHVKVAFLPVGKSNIELLVPLENDPNPPGEEWKCGLDHVCLEVKDIDAMVATLKKNEISLINPEPVTLPGRKLIFVDPISTGGARVEFYELTNN